MAMLAEPRNKRKISINPNGNAWSNGIILLNVIFKMILINVYSAIGHVSQIIQPKSAIRFRENSGSCLHL